MSAQPRHNIESVGAFTFRRATLDDQKLFKSILAESPMILGEESYLVRINGPVETALSEDRRGRTCAIMFLDHEKKVFGCASVTLWTRAVLKNVGLTAGLGVETVGYLGDFRLKKGASRRAKLVWRQVYTEFAKACFSGSLGFRCDAIVTSVLNQNTAAVKAFTDERNDFVYKPVLKYTTYSFLMPKAESTKLNKTKASYRFNVNKGWKSGGGDSYGIFTLVDSGGSHINDIMCEADILAKKMNVDILQIACASNNKSSTLSGLKTNAFHWVTDATLYEVKLKLDKSPEQMKLFADTSADGLFLDASQL